MAVGEVAGTVAVVEVEVVEGLHPLRKEGPLATSLPSP